MFICASVNRDKFSGWFMNQQQNVLIVGCTVIGSIAFCCKSIIYRIEVQILVPPPLLPHLYFLWFFFKELAQNASTKPHPIWRSASFSFFACNHFQRSFNNSTWRKCILKLLKLLKILLDERKYLLLCLNYEFNVISHVPEIWINTKMMAYLWYK